MKKTYKVEVDCAACAEKMQEAARKTLIIATHKEEIIKDLADGTFMLG